MNSEFEIRRIYEAARALEPIARAAFIVRECSGDRQLQAEVEARLTMPDDHTRPPSNAAPAAVTPALVGDSLAYGQRVGHYAVGERLGVGGMGEVFVA